MRAFPADSLEYWGETAEGKTASLVAGAIFGAAAGLGEVLGTAGAVVVVVGAGAAAGVAVVESEPHSAFLKSLHFIPLRVPAV